MGSMANYITSTNAKNFQPMNANFGLFPELEERIKNKKERNEAYAKRALETIQKFVKIFVKSFACNDYKCDTI